MMYFDNAATTYPKPRSVLSAVSSAAVYYGGNPGRSGHQLSLKTAQKVYEARQALAQLLHVPEEENIVFTLNCTHALNMAIKGAVEQGGHVVTSSLEHNSVMRPLYALSLSRGVSYSIAQVEDGDPDATLQNFEAAIRPDTKAVVCTFASNVTGTVLPIARIGDLCKKKKLLFIVDAAQAAGVLPVNMREQNIGVLCCAGHKSLMGVTGTGVMALAPGVELSTILEGGTGSASADIAQPQFLPDRFESGTINTVGIVSLLAGAQFLKRRGISQLYEHELNLCVQLYDELSARSGIRLYASHMRRGERAPVLSFNIEGMTSMEAADLLDAQGFAVRPGLHCAPSAHTQLGTMETGTIRFSPGFSTKSTQVAMFADAVKKIAKNKRSTT